jgi:hypothetical protein
MGPPDEQLITLRKMGEGSQIGLRDRRHQIVNSHDRPTPLYLSVLRPLPSTVAPSF